MSKKFRIIKEEGEKTEVLVNIAVLHDLKDRKLIVLQAKDEKEIPYNDLDELSQKTKALVLCIPKDIDLSVYSFELVED